MLLRFLGFAGGPNVAKQTEPWTVVLRLTGIGWYVAICIVIGVVGGLFLDNLAGTAPLFILLGTVLGSVVAFWGLFRMVQPILNMANPKDVAEDRGEDLEDKGRKP